MVARNVGTIIKKDRVLGGGSSLKGRLNLCSIYNCLTIVH